MEQMKFTASEYAIIKEIRRRIKEFKGGDKNKPMIFLGFPSETKSLVKKDIITPYEGREVKRALNWYNLTEEGKKHI